jgi:hypothetical protein
LIARHYPKVGGRHDAALVFGGFLARCGFSVSEVKLFAEAVAAASGQPADKRRDIVKTAADCVEAFAAGREACGLNKMGETFGAAVAALCAKWLGYRASRAGGATGHDSAVPEGGGLNFTGVEAAILAAPKHEACAVFVRLAMDADLDAAQAKLLAKAAGAQSGAGAKLAEKMLDEARAQRREAAAQAIRDKAAAESTRERIEGIFADDEIGPILRLLDDILSRVDAPEPPMRDAEGWPVEVQCRESAGLHELTAEGANAEESAKSRLASPKHFLLTRHEKESLEIEWGDHLCFVQKTKDGEHYVAPPEKFLNHFLKYRRSKLPRAHAVLTMPLVLPDGSLLAGNGLDRKRRAVFRIDPALLAFMPKPEDCGPDEVAEAFKHLTDHWLVDVSTDLDGKCVLIALALSIIERVLFAERPVFFVTGGLRGGGKTTALMMIALAATGTKAAAAAWSSDPDERKKAIFSYLLECLPVLIWDNIPRGATIGCPHIERASTCEFYQDRVLGVTKTRTAPAYTILAFTGNNIGPNRIRPRVLSRRGLRRTGRTLKTAILNTPTRFPGRSTTAAKSYARSTLSCSATHSSILIAEANRERGSRHGGPLLVRRSSTRPRRPAKRFPSRICSSASKRPMRKPRLAPICFRRFMRFSPARNSRRQMCWRSSRKARERRPPAASLKTPGSWTSSGSAPRERRKPFPQSRSATLSDRSTMRRRGSPPASSVCDLGWTLMPKQKPTGWNLSGGKPARLKAVRVCAGMCGMFRQALCVRGRIFRDGAMR